MRKEYIMYYVMMQRNDQRPRKLFQGSQEKANSYQTGYIDSLIQNSAFRIDLEKSGMEDGKDITVLTIDAYRTTASIWIEDTLPASHTKEKPMTDRRRKQVVEPEKA